MKKFIVLTPNKIDFDEIVTNQSQKLDNEYLKYITSYILSKLALYVENNKKKDIKSISVTKIYIPIHSKKDVLIRHDKHKKHMEFLISNFKDNIDKLSRTKEVNKRISILYRKKYKVDEIPFSYRINPRYTNKYLFINYLKSDVLINKIILHSSVKPVIIKSGKYKFLGKYFNPNKLKINIDEAISLCNDRYKKHKKYGKYLNEMYKIIDLNNGVYRFYYKVETDARLHTNISSFPKVYRKFITYDDKKLVECDLSNSIIYFLSMLINNKVSESVLLQSPLLLNFYKSLLTVDIKETELFNELAISGEFYNCFVSDFENKYTNKELKLMYEQENNKKYLGQFEQKRKVVKKRILAMIFANNESYIYEQEIFSLKFPFILRKMIDFKNENDYEKLSHILLQLESHYMLDVVARGFNRKNAKKAPIFTLHDCLITTNDFEIQLKETMSEIFVEKFKTPPKMELKAW